MKNKRVLILGASSDIGIELIKYFLNKKWNITAHYFSNNSKLKLIKSRKLKLIQMNFAEIDNSNKNLVVEKFSDNYDSLINLVGFIDNKTFNNLDIDSCLESIKINAIVPIFFMSFISNKMHKKQWGRILNCSSIGVKFGGGKNTFNYSISKKTLEFIPSDFRILAKNNVYINILRLGVVNTKIHKKISFKNLQKRKKLIPAGKIADIQDVVNFIYFLSSDENQFITGENITIAGGE